MSNKPKIGNSYNIVEVAFIDQKTAEIEFKNRLMGVRERLATKIFKDDINNRLPVGTVIAEAILLKNEDIGGLISNREEKERLGYLPVKDILSIGGVYFSFVMKLG